MRRAFVFGSVAIALAACSPEPGPPPAHADDAITIGSFNFAESRLLAELYAQALERAGIQVRRRFDIGTRELVEPALERGLIELVPEYGGSLLTFLTAQPAGSDPDEVHTALSEALSERGLAALAPAPAQDRNAVVVTRETASALELRALSDLADVDNRVVLGAPPECRDRPLCLPGMRATYGLSFRRFVPLDSGGPVTLEALKTNQVQAAVMFSSDGAIRANDLVVLRDDRGLQPAENVTPVVRIEAIDRFGRVLVDAVNAVSAALTTDVLRTLNELVVVRGRSPAGVVAEWLDARGLTGAR